MVTILEQISCLFLIISVRLTGQPVLILMSETYRIHNSFLNILSNKLSKFSLLYTLNRNNTSQIMYRTFFLLLTIYVTKLTSTITFPLSSVTGVLIAIAVPIDLPNYNVFMSYNFEANYNLPQQATVFTQGPLLFRVQREEKGEGHNTTVESQNKTRPAFEPLITRKRIYQWIEAKLKV